MTVAANFEHLPLRTVILDAKRTYKCKSKNRILHLN